MSDYLDLVEQMLHQTAPQPDRRFQDNLRRQLLNEFEAEWAKASFQPQVNQRRRWLMSAAAAVGVMLLLIIGLTPTGQIIANMFLQFGSFTLTDAPSAAEQHLTATPTPVYPVKTAAVGLPEANGQPGFTIFFPGYLPDDYSSSTSPTVKLVYNRQEETSSIETMLVSRNGGHILYYTQIRYTPDPNRPPFDLDIGQAEATPVRVGEYEGVWLEDFNWGAGSRKTPVAYNILIWLLTTPTGETFTFWLGSEEKLSLKEMLKIAESMSSANAGPSIPLNLTFGDNITLLGFDLTTPNGKLKLFWQAGTTPQSDLMAFVHWRDMNNVIKAQVDRPYATHRWRSDQTIVETYDFSQLNLPPGSYILVVGLYDPDTARRLAVPGYPNAEVQLTKVEIEN